MLLVQHVNYRLPLGPGDLGRAKTAPGPVLLRFEVRCLQSPASDSVWDSGRRDAEVTQGRRYSAVVVVDNRKQPVLRSWPLAAGGRREALGPPADAVCGWVRRDAFGLDVRIRLPLTIFIILPNSVARRSCVTPNSAMVSVAMLGCASTASRQCSGPSQVWRRLRASSADLSNSAIPAYPGQQPEATQLRLSSAGLSGRRRREYRRGDESGHLGWGQHHRAGDGESDPAASGGGPPSRPRSGRAATHRRSVSLERRPPPWAS